MMEDFTALIKFTSTGSDQCYFARVKTTSTSHIEPPALGETVTAYASLEDLQNGKSAGPKTIDQLLAPLPSSHLPIYCVGLNYRSHAKEASLAVPSYAPLWTKPAAALANPDEVISLNDHLAKSLPDYEGELVFVTAKQCKDITPAQAESYILGYTVGNDLSCRFYQLQRNNGGQFFYAKAFDKFAPIGPVLVSAKHFKSTDKGRRLRTRVNGSVVQDVEINTDMIFGPAKVLSQMSQGTTIPAGTAVMTGTPAGVGAFRSPKTFLKDGDSVTVEITDIGVLSNKISFAKTLSSDGSLDPMTKL